MQEHSHQTAFNYHAMPRPQPHKPATPLVHQMAVTADTAALKRLSRLVKSGVIETDINATDEKGDNLLHSVARMLNGQGASGRLLENFLETLKLAVEMGADPRQKNYDGKTPAQIARNPEFSKAIGVKSQGRKGPRRKRGFDA